ncbi:MULTISPECIES: hypothetical protein [Bacillus]|uniref:hypothetical protein n=1 Tax=Bacillus TaxID=1386 RepID=UPI0011A9D722|nr:hypothetical protein [Bacillus subtilis]MBU8610614.1 hypothetical protein [Bacillus subtilis]MBU8717661.1 hypothetical protein [Bacillus subtilis]TWG62971.1 hypothetical protein L608_000100010130 [Bacillus subtilis J23]TWG65464.1 hypothetical protein L606_000600001490 [Bacillus subtilis J25]
MDYRIINESSLINTLERHLNMHLLDDVLERLRDEISSGYDQMIIIHVRKDNGGDMVANLYFHFRVLEENETESDDGVVLVEFVMYDPHVIRKDYEENHLKNGGRI